jgi:outer membrane receptor for monomeric catechols
MVIFFLNYGKYAAIPPYLPFGFNTACRVIAATLTFNKIEPNQLPDYGVYG